MEAKTLWEDEGLIVIHKDGQLYTNQTGGISCNHPQAEGTFYPMKIPEEIKNYMCAGSCRLSLDESEKSKLSSIFIENNMPMEVIDGEEAWLQVKLGNDMDGILTWENCD